MNNTNNIATSIKLRTLAEEFAKVLADTPPSLWATWLLYPIECMEEYAIRKQIMYRGENPKLGNDYDGGSSYASVLEDIFNQIGWRKVHGAWE